MSTAQNLTNAPTTPQVKVPQLGSSQAGPSGTGTFIPGVGSNTIVALLLVMEDMMEISNIYGKLLVDQLTTQQTVATSLGQYAKNQANDQAKQMTLQGWMGIAGGVVTGGIGAWGLASSPKGLDELDGQIKGAQSYRDYLEEKPTTPQKTISNSEETPSKITEEDIKALKNKNGEDFLKEQKGRFGTKKVGIEREDIANTDKEKLDLIKTDKAKLEELKNTYDEKIKELNQLRNAKTSEYSSKSSTWTQTAGALSGTLSGTGQVASSYYKLDEGQDEANKNLAQAALSTAQGIASETRNSADSYIGKSAEVVQLISAISNANKLVGG